MTVYRKTSTTFERVRATTFAEEELLERNDLQRLLKADISVLGADLMVIAEEFGDWEESRRRIDLLCLDEEGTLVVVELKRTDDGGYMDLQALRYAAMVSSMTVDQLLDAHVSFLGKGATRASAEAAVRTFLGVGTDTNIEIGAVRILLAAADFSKELMTSVLWLNKRDLDIRCVRMQPYRLGDDVLLDVQQIVPLPEAEDYEIRVRAQAQEARRGESERHIVRRKFWAQLIERSRGRTEVVAGRHAVSDDSLSGLSGRGGFHFNFVLLKEEARVECYIDLGKGQDQLNLTALRMLRDQCAQIEQAFGAPLDWQELEDARACRICAFLPGGWRTPESEWPVLQDRMIDAMVRLERALRSPVLELRLPEGQVVDGSGSR